MSINYSVHPRWTGFVRVRSGRTLTQPVQTVCSRVLSRLVLLLTIAGGLFCGLTTEAVAADKILTLDQAIRMALTNNFAVQQAAANVRMRQGDVIHARRPVPSNPTLSLLAGRRSGPDRQTTDIGISFSQALWTNGKGELGANAARNRRGAAEQQLDYLKTLIVARTRAAFLAVLSADKSLETAKRLVKLNRDIRDFARRRLHAGEGTQLELNAAIIGLGRAQAAEAEARQQRTQARLALTDQLALDPSDFVQVTGHLMPKRLTIADTQTLLRRSLQRRADLTAAARKVAAARNELRLADSQMIPNLRVGGYYKREVSDDIAGITLSAPIPLFHRFTGEQHAAQARLDRAQIDQDALRLKVRRQVLLAVAEYRAARKRVSVFGNRVLDRAENNLALTRRAVKAGQLGAPAITTAQNNLMAVRRQYLGAIDALIQAGADLERSTGGLIHLGTQANNESGEKHPS